jgi:hypothetical protein
MDKGHTTAGDRVPIRPARPTRRPWSPLRLKAHATSIGISRGIGCGVILTATVFSPAPEPLMPQVIYMLPKRTYLAWDPRLEPLDLERKPGLRCPYWATSVQGGRWKPPKSTKPSGCRAT